MALFLTEADVSRLITIPEVIEAVDQSFRELGTGAASNRPRQRAILGKVQLHTLSGAMPSIGRVGLKAYTTGPNGARFQVMLFDEGGALISLIEANKLGQVRTGCASAVGARHLAREDAHTVGLIGTGRQSWSQLAAVCAVRPIKEARVYSRNPENAAKFCDQMSAELPGVRLTPVPDGQSAVSEAQIVITITNAKEPVLHGQWLSPGTTILAAGSNHASTRELDNEAISRCGFITVDSVEQAQIESGDLMKPVADGILQWEQVHELGAVVAGKLAGRRSPEEINLFKSNGLGIQDVAAAHLVYTKALAQGIGVELPF